MAKAKKIIRPKLVRRTAKWVREQGAAWAALMDATPELPDSWFPDLPSDCSGSEPDEQGEPEPGGGEGEPTPGDEAQEAGEGGSGVEAAETGEPTPGDDDDEGEGEGGDEAGGETGETEATPPEPVKLTPRGTTFRPADQQDYGSIFSHFSKKDDRGQTIYRREFSSVQDFISQPFSNPGNLEIFRKDMLDAETGTWRSWKRRALRGLTRKTDLEWYGAASGDLAADRAIHGWPEGAERVRQLLADIETPQPVSVKRKLRRGDQGDELDIHAVYRGAIDRAWSRRQRTHHRSRMTVRLCINLGGSQLMNQEEMFWRGAAIAKLSELLEDAGYGVELMCTQSERMGPYNATTHMLFCLKDAGTPVNLEQVAGVVCNAGFFRTWGFRSVYAISEQQLKYDPEETVLGNCYVNHIDHLEHEEYRLGADGTPTFSVPESVEDVESAREFINETLAMLAADVQEAA